MTSSSSSPITQHLSPIGQVPSFSAASDDGEVRVVRNGDRFVLVGVDSGGTINVLESSSLRTYARNGTGNASKLSPWSSTKLAADPSDSTFELLTNKRLGVVAVGGATLIFWVDTNTGTIGATRVVPDSARSPTDWCQLVVPATDASTGSIQMVPVTVPSGGISVTPGPGDGALILSFLTTAGGAGLQACQINLNYAGYDASRNLWAAEASPWYLPVASTAPSSSALASYDLRCIVAVVPKSDGTTATFQLGAVWDSAGSTLTTQAWQLLPDASGPSATPARSVSLQWPGGKAKRNGDGLALTVDPAGRLLGAFGDADHEGDLKLALIADLKPLGDATTTTLAWTEYSAPFRSDSTSDDEDTEGPMSVSFLVSDRPTIPGDQPLRHPVVMSLFWIRASGRTDSPVLTASLHYADAQVSQKVSEPLSSADASWGSKRYVTTVCDPFPMPQPSPTLWGNSTPDGMADWLMFEYALLDGHTHTHVVDMTWKLGLTFEVEAEYGTEDAGVRLGMKAKGGVNWATEDTTSTYTAQGMKVQSKACFHPLDPMGADGAGPYAVRPYGSYAGKAMFALREVTYTVSNLALTPQGTGSTFTTTAYSAALRPANQDTIVGDFFAYACTPGDLDSYLEANINRRMAGLYQRLVANLSAGGWTDDQIDALFTERDDDGNVIDLSQFYTGNNYVQAVIRQYGVTLSPKKDGPKYVAFALSGGSVSDGSYIVKRGSSFGFGGYLDLSAYIEGYEGPTGATPGAEVSLGVEFSFTRMVTDTDEDNTAIGMATYYNPLSATQSLTARLYAFRPSKLWSIELQYFPDMARDDYVAMLKSKCTPASGIDPAIVDGNPDIARTISNGPSLLIDRSRPARYMMVVSNWDDGGYPIDPTYAITATYPTSSQGRPARGDSSPGGARATFTASNTGADGTPRDPNYLCRGEPAYLGSGHHWIAAPEGAAWISLSENAGGGGANADNDFTTTITVQGGQGQDLTALVVRGRCAADDRCTILVNGVQVESPTGAGATGYQSLSDFSIPGSYLQPGDNTLTFRVHNNGGPTGLLVVFDASPSSP